jgi:hypothetical protein
MPIKLVDREEEIARLKEAIERPPQLVILRGRRRVGKSFLLDRCVQGRRNVFLQADEQTERAHLDLFAREAARLLPGQPPLRFEDWDAALRFVTDQASQGPLIVLMDEFQWLVRAQPAFASIIQRHWDSWDRERTPVTLVLCGSALALMEGLLARDAPLYGRAGYRPLLLPLDFRQAAAFAPAGADAMEKLQRYAVLGGTPQYQLWAGRGELTDVLVERILRKGESLYEEPLHLLREEQQIRDPGTYFAVVAAIARGATRPSEIANATQLEVPNLIKMLRRLSTLGYLETRAPVSPKREAKRTNYRLRDPFFRFWFRYVFPNRSLLERGRTREVLAEIERDLDNFMGAAFEDCCRDWVGRYATEKQAPCCEKLGAWWSRDGQTEIDVAGVSRRAYVLLGSCKWDRKTRTHILGRLLDHRDRLGPPAAAARLVIFARGFDPALIQRAEQEGVGLVTAAELFAQA